MKPKFIINLLLYLIFSVSSIIVSASELPIPQLSVILSLSPANETITNIENITQKLLDDYEIYVTKTLEGNIKYKYDLIKALSIDFSKSLTVYQHICNTLNIEELNMNDESLILKGLKTLLIDFKKETLEKEDIILNVEVDQEVTISKEN